MRRISFPWIWTGFVAVTSVGLLGVLFLSSAIPEVLAGVIGAIGWLVLPVLFTTLGAIIATRQPGNRISWLLFIIGSAVLVDATVTPFILEAPVEPTFWNYLTIVLSSTMWLGIFFPIFHLLFVFPTGHFLTPRWRWAAWLEGLMVSTVLTLGLFTEEFGPPSQEWVIANPIGLLPANFFNEGLFGAVWGLGLALMALGGLVAMIVRYRRSSSIIRTQIKWVLYAAVLFSGAHTVVLVLQSWTDGEGALFSLLFVPSIASIPISITIAITRYRLFEIDRIISRTLSYALIVVILAAVFAGVVTLTTSILPSQNSLAVAASTLAVAALFNPIRRRVQRVVDRRFNRAGYSATTVTEEFAARLQDKLDVGEITDAWTNTVNDAIQPAFAAVWIRDNEKGSASHYSRR